MKIKLINPSKKNKNQKTFFDFNLLTKAFDIYPPIPLAIPTLAELTPNDIEVTVTDENVDNVNFDEKIDLVGITALTPNILRTYEIADTFRKRGIKVVLGGIHVSMLPDEAIQHADSVVIGEAETVWNDLLSDAKTGKLKPFYKAENYAELDKTQEFRNFNIPNDPYMYSQIQTTRGCPFDCDFCVVRKFLGYKMRLKNITKIINEINSFPQYTTAKIGPLKFKLPRDMLIVDDNITGNRKHAKSLFKNLIPLKIVFSCQASIDLYKHKDLLKMMKDAGCEAIFIGFESVSQKTLNSFGKKNNKVDEYEQAIETIHSFGIKLMGSFMIGCDGDDETIFEETANFIKKTDVFFPMLNLLTPIPGTRLFNKFETEGRLLHKNWDLYDTLNVVFKPKNMSAQTLQDGLHWLYQDIYSEEVSLRKLLDLPFSDKISFSNCPLKEKISVLFGTLLLRKNIKNKDIIMKLLHEILLKNKSFNLTDIMRLLSLQDMANSLPEGKLPESCINTAN